MSILNKIFSIVLMTLTTLLIVISGGHSDAPELLNEIYGQTKK